MPPNMNYNDRDDDDCYPEPGYREFNDNYSDHTKQMIEANGEEYPGQYYVLRPGDKGYGGPG